MVITEFMTFVIIVNLAVIISATIPNLRVTPTTCPNPACSNTDLCPGFEICAPVDAPIFTLVNTICVVLFTIDYGIRVLICPLMPTRLCGIVSDDWNEKEQKLAAAEDRTPRDDPEYSWFHQLFAYLTLPMNLVDLVAILPFFIILGLNDPSSGQRLSFIRTLRLFRLFKLFKFFKGPMSVLQRALYESREVFAILALSFMIAVIFFAVIIFDAEQGEFEVSNYTVSQGFQYGAYVRASKDNQGIDISPFDSITTSMYWAVITITTVGYGDLTPLTRDGRMVTCFAAVVGIFVIALPVGVVGTNFTAQFEIYNNQVQEAKARAREQLRAISTFSPSASAIPGLRSIAASVGSAASSSTRGEGRPSRSGERGVEFTVDLSARNDDLSKISEAPDAGGRGAAISVENPMIDGRGHEVSGLRLRVSKGKGEGKEGNDGDEDGDEDEAAARSRATAEATALLALPPAQRQEEVERLLLERAAYRVQSRGVQQLEVAMRRLWG